MPEETPTEAPSVAAESLESSEGTDTLPEATEPQNETQGSKEAKYRIRAREAETQLEATRSQLESYQTRELERVAAETLADAGDLLTLSGRSLSEFITEDGSVDADAVREAAESVLASRPRLGKNVPAHDPSQGRGTYDQSAPRSLSWADLLRDT